MKTVKLTFILSLSALLIACGGGTTSLEKPDAAQPSTKQPTVDKPTIAQPNHAPVLHGSAKTTTHVSEIYQYKPQVEDADGDRLTFSIQNRPAWASFDTQTGLLSGVPSSEGNNSDITISVTDGNLTTTLPPFSIMIDARVNIAHKYGVAAQGGAVNYYYYKEASLALDNDLNTSNHTQCTPTTNWWQVALPQTKISQVVVHNRPDYPSRLAGAKIYISDKAYDGNLEGLEAVATLSAAQEQVFDLSKEGSFLFIKADRDQCLHMSEVQVYGESTPMPRFEKHEEEVLVSIRQASDEAVTTVRARDFQEDTLMYAIVGDVPFRVDSHGNIYKKEGAKAGNYRFDVRVSDAINSTQTPIMITVTQEDAVENSLRSGDVGSVTEEELVEATLVELEAVKNLMVDAKNQIFDGINSIDWNPTHDACRFRPTTGENVSFLKTNDGTNIKYKDIALIGQKEASRYIMMGTNPFRTQGNSDMEKVLKNAIFWLSGETVPKNIVIAQLAESYYFQDESSTRAWLDSHYEGVRYNKEDACDGAKLAGCLKPDTDLLILSQIGEADEVDTIVQTVNKAMKEGIPVLYIHHDGDLKPLGKRLFSSVFDVRYDGDNYWDRLRLTGYNPAEDRPLLSANLKSVKRVFEHFKAKDYAFDWGECHDSSGDMNEDADSCENVTGLSTEFEEGVQVVKAIMKKLDEDKKDIFQTSQYRLYKLLALTGDKFRQSVHFPMDKVKSDDMAFMKSFYADCAVYNYRLFNPVQPDMGNFSRSDFSHITPISKKVDMESKRYFRSAGLYALPGKTVTVTRHDTSPLKVKIFVNTLRSGSTHQYEKDGYKRPKYLQTPHMEIGPGERISFTSPYGGTLQVAFSENDLPVSLTFDHVGEHAYWRGTKDDASFAQKLEAGDFDWAEVATSGFEVHSTLEKMRESVMDEKWKTASALAAATEKYLSNYPHVLAGFQGPGIDVVDEIHDFATVNNLTIHTLDKVKHMNADQASCGYGCSGNPYDAYWAFSPVGHGDIHELGHGLEKRRFLFEGWERHATTNPYSYYTKSKYNQNGGETACQNLPFREMFNALQQSQKEPDASAYLKSTIWATSSWPRQFMVMLQAMMHTQKMGKLEDGWHLLARLHILERELYGAKKAWDEKKASLGFDTYSKSEIDQINNNDWMLVSLSFASGLDFREYLSMMGISYSDKAAAQVASFGYEVVPKKFFISTPNGYCTNDKYGDFLDKNMLDIDGTTVWREETN